MSSLSLHLLRCFCTHRCILDFTCGFPYSLSVSLRQTGAITPYCVISIQHTLDAETVASNSLFQTSHGLLLLCIFVVLTRSIA